MQAALNKDNLNRLAWLNGHRGVADLARKIGRTRQTIYRALVHPNIHKPTLRLLNKALPRRDA